MVNKSYVNPNLGVTVLQTNVTPNVSRLPASQVPTTSAPAVWSNLAAGTYLVTCNYYQKNKSSKPATITQTVTITNANQTYSFSLS